MFVLLFFVVSLLQVIYPLPFSTSHDCHCLGVYYPRIQDPLTRNLARSLNGICSLAVTIEKEVVTMEHYQDELLDTDEFEFDDEVDDAFEM